MPWDFRMQYRIVSSLLLACLLRALISPCLVICSSALPSFDLVWSWAVYPVVGLMIFIIPSFTGFHRSLRIYLHLLLFVWFYVIRTTGHKTLLFVEANQKTIVAPSPYQCIISYREMASPSAIILWVKRRLLCLVGVTLCLPVLLHCAVSGFSAVLVPIFENLLWLLIRLVPTCSITENAPANY
jgi:hypothetical protein